VEFNIGPAFGTWFGVMAGGGMRGMFASGAPWMSPGLAMFGAVVG
jgi:hypothetical protein